MKVRINISILFNTANSLRHHTEISEDITAFFFCMREAVS